MDDTEYSSAEQFLQSEKAKVCNALSSVRKIMSKTNPWYMKIAGDKLEDTKNWKTKRMETLYRGIFAKFDQNSPLKRALLDTDGLDLYEATTDLYYACDIGLDSPKWDSGDWPGENVTGKILMKVREEFLAEDTLGQSQHEIALSLNTSQAREEESMDEDLRNSSAIVPRTWEEAETDEDWPDLNQSHAKSYTETVESPKDIVLPDTSAPKQANKITSQTPILNKGHPHVTQ